MKRLTTWRISQPVLMSFLALVVVVLSSLLGTLAHRNLMIQEQQAHILELNTTIQEQRVIVERFSKRVRIQEALKFITRNKMDTSTLYRTSNQLFQVSNSMGFDPLLILALVGVESRGDPRAIGRYRSGKESGAVGLMQIKATTAEWVAKKLGHEQYKAGQLIKAEQNILYGTLYLMDLVQKYESLTLGVMAYNVGPGALSRYLKYNQSKLPKRYLNKMLSNYYSLIEQFGEEPA